MIKACPMIVGSTSLLKGSFSLPSSTRNDFLSSRYAVIALRHFTNDSVPIRVGINFEGLIFPSWDMLLSPFP